MIKINDFSYDTYRQILNTCLKSHVCLTFSDFRKGNPQEPFLLLRHDIDMSPAAALNMAEIEASLGIKATYFVLCSSPWYNLFDGDYIGFPRQLAKMGHEVGLHYDVNVLEKAAQESSLELLMLQSQLLSRLSDSEVRSIAMHNPSLSGHDPFRGISEFMNAYDDNFTRRIAYFSDSCGAWRDEFIICLKEESFPLQMQLLIHPIFWGNVHQSRWEKLAEFISRNNNQLFANGEQTKKIWSEHPAVIKHDRR